MLTTTDFQATSAFFTDLIGFKASDYIGDVGVFLRCSTDHHNLLILSAPAVYLHHTAWQVDDIDDIGRAASALLEGHPERHVWGLGRHHAGSNFFWYLRDPAGNYCEYYADLDEIPEDMDWLAESHAGSKGLYNWGPPPPPSFLEPDDLTELVAMRRSLVIALSPADLLELTEARRELETLTLRHAIADGDVEWESRLLAAHHRLARASQLDPDDPERLSDAWVTAHAEFHDTLLDGCTNQRLKNITSSLRASAELYRRWSVPLGHGSDRDIAKEHASMLAAVLARDADQAVADLTAHVERTTKILLASPENELEPGVAPPLAHSPAVSHVD